MSVLNHAVVAVSEEMPATPEERRAIASMHRLARRWPAGLWLYSASGTLCVMRYGPDGDRLRTPAQGNDPAAVLATIDIPNDGGDW